MAVYTHLSVGDIKRILAHYPGLANKSFTFKGIALGTVNTYYRLCFAGKRVLYLKIDEVGEKKRLINELAILEVLRRQQKNLGFLTPTPLPTKKRDHFIPWGKKFALLFAEVPGKIIFENQLGMNQIKEIGKALAHLHQLRLPRQIRSHRFCLAGLNAVFKQIRSRLTMRLPEIEKIIARRLRTLSRQAPRQKCTTLIHADLFAENIHWMKGRLVGILDFEASGRGEALFDLGVAIHALCHDRQGFSVAKIGALLMGYESVRPMKPSEASALPYFLDLTAMRFLLTRLRDFELAPGPVKAEPFKDYREFVRRFDENQALL